MPAPSRGNAEVSGVRQASASCAGSTRSRTRGDKERAGAEPLREAGSRPEWPADPVGIDAGHFLHLVPYLRNTEVSQHYRPRRLLAFP